MAAHALVKVDDVSQSGELIQLVSFTLNGEEYGIEVLKVREIIRMPSLTKTPKAAQFIEGIIDLRGKVIPIISLRRRFSLPDSEHNSHTRIIIVDVEGNQAGFIVDGVAEVIRIHSSDVQPPPSIILSGGVGPEFITGVFNHAERLLIMMDIDRMFSAEDHGSLGQVCN